jgi:hypothetical protein
VSLSQHKSTVDLITILLSTLTDSYMSVVVKEERWMWRFYFTAHNLDCNIQEISSKSRQKNTHQSGIYISRTNIYCHVSGVPWRIIYGF